MAERTSGLLTAWSTFLAPPADGAVGEEDAEQRVLTLFRSSAARVPAYREFLTEHGVVASSVQTIEDFRRVPCTTKDNYYRRHALPRLCWDDRRPFGDMLAFSSGSTGEPTIWPRSVQDELRMTDRFEQVLVGAFGADRRSTLVVVCFALGTWVGGMYTTACCRHLAAKGHLLTVVTPGNQKSEIFRVLQALDGQFEQIVLCGYPPFLKDVVAAGAAEGRDWSKTPIHLLMAGEVFSEEWRTLIGTSLHIEEGIERRTASLYGTADGGVLANETPLSIQIRRALAARPELAKQLFGEARLPTLCQYDPGHRYFEADEDGYLLISGDHGAPLLRYKILDRGGIIPYAQMTRFLADHGIDVTHEGPARPFVYVFGRSNFAISFYGANVFPENVAAGLERPEFATYLTGKFVFGVEHDDRQDAHLLIDVELAASCPEVASGLAPRVADAVRLAIESANSEFLNYAPPDRRTPRIRLRPFGDPDVFPAGVKHRYVRS